MKFFTTYNVKRRLVQLGSTLLIVALPFFNILRLDIPTLRFYFFNSVLWVDEFYILFLVIMLILFVIVIFSMMYGRVWCGWMCPQTVLSEFTHWFEHKTKRWLRVPKSGGSALRQITSYTLFSFGVMAVSFVIAFNLVAFFIDPYRMSMEIFSSSLGIVTTGILIGITFIIFIDVTFWREEFCKKACPYGMLQMVITDSRTQIVRYQTERNEECIQCKACVRDCMMGIDIRTSPYQTECIHCGDCVDSCTAILSRLDKPTLISFSWGEQHKEKRWYEKLGLVDAKRWISFGFITLYTVVLLSVIHYRQPLSLTASGDRSTLFRKDANGQIFNDYIVKLSNRSMSDGTFRITCSKSSTQYNGCILHIDDNPFSLKSREAKTLKMSISTYGLNLHPGPNTFELEAVNTLDERITTKTEIVFFMPQQELLQKIE